jgi:hypothetical protein
MSNADHVGSYLIGAAVAAFCVWSWLEGRNRRRAEAAFDAACVEAVDAMDAAYQILSNEPIYTQLCADIAREEAQFIATEWWLHNRNGNPSL